MLARRSFCDKVEKPLRIGVDRPAGINRGDERVFTFICVPWLRRALDCVVTHQPAVAGEEKERGKGKDGP